MILAIVAAHVVLTLIGCAALWAKASVSSRLLTARILVAALLCSPFVVTRLPRVEVETPTRTLPQHTSQDLEHRSSPAGTVRGATVGSQNSPIASPLRWTHTLSLLWVMGCILFLVKLAWDFLILRRHLRMLEPLLADDYASVKTYLPHKTQCLIDPTASGAYSVSIWGRTLITPPHILTDISKARLECIVRHEAAHLRHWDSIDTVFWRLVTACFWWNPLVYLLTTRVTELQEWRADQECAGTYPHRALELSRALIEHAQVARQAWLAHSMAALSATQLKRRVQRLLEAPTERTWKPRATRVLWILLLLACIGSHVACKSLLPPKATNSGIPGHNTVKAMDHAEISMRLNEEASKVTNQADTDDLVAIEFKFFEMGADAAAKELSRFKFTELGGTGSRLAPPIEILDPASAKAFITRIVKSRETTQVSYPRVLTKNRRTVTIRSVINEPIGTSIDPVTKTSRVDSVPVGTVIGAAPVILKSGDIHCELQMTISSIIGERIIEGRKFPTVSSRVFSAPLVMPSGHSIVIHCLDEVLPDKSSSGKPIAVLVTATRLTGN